MGYDKPRSLGDSAQAALYTAPIFRDFMKMALKDTPDTPFRVPPGIKLISVDVHSGMRATGPGSILEAFKPGTGPPDSYAGRRRGGGAEATASRRPATSRSARERAASTEASLPNRPEHARRRAVAWRFSTRGSAPFGPKRIWTMRAEAEQLVEDDQAVRGTAEEASLTSRQRRGV